MNEIIGGLIQCPNPLCKVNLRIYKERPNEPVNDEGVSCPVCRKRITDPGFIVRRIERFP